MHVVCVLRGYISLWRVSLCSAVCMCFTWLCKPRGGTTLHVVRVLRGYVTLEGIPLCTWYVFYVAVYALGVVSVLRGYVSLGKVPLCT